MISVAGRAKMAVADEFRKLAMGQLSDVMPPLLDLIFEQYYRPIVDDTLQKSVEAAKAKCLLKFHQAAKDISQVEQSEGCIIKACDHGRMCGVRSLFLRDVGSRYKHIQCSPGGPVVLTMTTCLVPSGGGSAPAACAPR